MARFPIAVVGAGPAGRDYLRSCQGDWRLEVVGFCNRSEERRHAVAKELGLPGFADLDGLLAGVERKPQVIVIATANPTHRDFAIAAMEAGCDVFCEKPMALTLEDCEAMLAAEQRTGRVLQIGFEYRYGSMTARLKELQEGGHFGAMRTIDIVDSRGHWWPDAPDTEPQKVWRLNPEIGGGPIIHCGIHEIDLLRYYAGEVVELQAFVPRNSLEFYPDHAPDHVNIQFRFASGATGSFTLYHNIAGTWYRPVSKHQPHYPSVPGHGLDIIMSGTNGSAVCEIYAEQLHLNRFDHANRETVYLRSEHFGHHHHNVSHHNTPQMIIDFALSIRDGKGALHSASDSYRTTRLGMLCEQAVQEAIAEGWSSSRFSL